MTNKQLYNDLLHLFEKEVKAETVRMFIHQNVPEPYASIYCKQFDEAKNVADFLEYMDKLRRGL